jgi:hypothetical protein
MLFMYIHTHSVEKCLMDKPQEGAKIAAYMKEEAAKANIKITAYSAPHEHTWFAIIEANDVPALEKMLAPMTTWGDASLTPIMTMEQSQARPPN